MTTTLYDYKIPVNYTDNMEYRNCFRKVFRIDTEQILENLKKQHEDFDNFEEETIDELLFDEKKVDEIMEDILQKTTVTETFRDFYKKAAGFMMSESMDIGLAVIMSYDYLHEFHAVLVEWFEWLETQDGDLDKIKGSQDAENFLGASEPVKKLREHLYKGVAK